MVNLKHLRDDHAGTAAEIDALYNEVEVLIPQRESLLPLIAVVKDEADRLTADLATLKTYSPEADLLAAEERVRQMEKATDALKATVYKRLDSDVTISEI